jgi:hypothetical protein
MQECNCCLCLSLPMRIAREVFESITNISSLSSTLFPLPLSRTHAVPSCLPHLLRSRQWVRENLSVICVQGCDLSSSSVHPNSVILTMQKQSKDPRLVDKDTSLRILHNFLSSYSHHKQVISRVVLVQNVISSSISCQSSDGRGGSQSAEELQHQVSYIYNIQSPSPQLSATAATGLQEDLKSLHNLSSHRQSYLGKMISSLKLWKIQLILCPEPIPSEVIDACSEHHIIILPCPLPLLHKLSRLLLIEPVEDLLDLTEDSVTTVTSSNSQHEGVLTIKLENTVRVIDDADGVQEGAALYPQQESSLFILSVITSAPSFPSHSPSPPLPMRFLPEHSPHTSVILRCPSAISGSHLRDRIFRCLSRLAHLLCQSNDYCGFHLSSSAWDLSPQLLCGGGLVELLCAIECSSLLSSEGSLEDESRAFLRGFRDVFQRFVQIINENNGATEEESLRSWEESEASLREAIQLSCHSQEMIDEHQPMNLTKLVSELPCPTKWKLVPPVQIASSADLHTCGCDRVLSPSSRALRRHQHPPLDLYSLKIEMIQAALYAVKLILHIDTVV